MDIARITQSPPDEAARVEGLPPPAPARAPAPAAPRPRAPRGSWGVGLIAAGMFLLLAALLTWPRLANAATSVVDAGDPLEDVWTLRWIDQALLTDPARLYDAPIFHG